MDKDLTPPEPGASDLAYNVGRSLLSEIPFVDAGIELFNGIVKPPYEKRLDHWRADVGQAISVLAKSKGLALKDLSSNEVFIDIITQATQAALKTNQKEKREALKSAVLNSTSIESPDESLSHMFIRFVDELTAWHLKAIQLLYDPEYVKEQTGKDVCRIKKYEYTEIMIYVYPELKNNKHFIEQVFNDLHNRGLMIAKHQGVRHFSDDILDTFRTVLGVQFYQFITYSENK